MQMLNLMLQVDKGKITSTKGIHDILGIHDVFNITLRLIVQSAEELIIYFTLVSLIIILQW